MKFSGKNVKGVIFDVDGTMFDTERLRIKMLNKASKELTGITLSNEVLNSLLGLSYKDSEKLIKNIYGNDYPHKEVRQRSDELELEVVKKFGVPIKDGLIDTLKFFKKNNIPMAVATSNNRKMIDDYIRRANIRANFDIIVCGDEVKNSKPSPEIFLTTAKKLGIKPENILVFEDSTNGLKAAYSAKMIPIFVKDMITPNKDVLRKTFKRYESMDNFLKDIKRERNNKLLENLQMFKEREKGKSKGLLTMI